MRVLYATPRPLFPMLFGGAARATHRLLDRLGSAHGVECRALCSAVRADLLPAAGLGDLEVRSLTTDDRGWSLDMGYPLRVAKDFSTELDQALEEFRPTVLCSHLVGADEVLRAGDRHGIPGLWYLHDYLPETSASIAKQNDSQRQATLFVACCEFVRDWVGRTHGVDARVVYPIIDLELYAVERPGATLLTMINPNPIKGVETLLELAALLPENPFLLVECWPLDGRVAPLRARLARLPNVRFAGRQADVRGVYRQTKILLVPSLMEAFSLSVREAQASGIVVVASNLGGLPEVVGDGGLLVDDYQNPQAWAESIRTLTADEAHLGRLSELARKNTRQDRLSLATNVHAFWEACRSAERGGRA